MKYFRKTAWGIIGMFLLFKNIFDRNQYAIECFWVFS